MVMVVEGNVLHHVKREGKMSGGMSEGRNVLHSREETISVIKCFIPFH